MNYLFYILFIMSYCYADKQQELFLQGQEYARQEAYDKALKAYGEITHPGFTTYYNQGVCLYNTKQFIDAFVAFKRASKHATYKTSKMTDYALHKTAHEAGFEYRIGWKEVIEKSTYIIPLLLAQLICLLSLICFICMIFYRVRVIWKVLIGLCTVLQITYVTAVWYIQSMPEAIAHQTLSYYIGPAVTYTCSGTFAQGTILKVVNTEKNWYKVKSFNKVGWVQEQDLIIV